MLSFEERKSQLFFRRPPKAIVYQRSNYRFTRIRKVLVAQSVDFTLQMT